MDDFKYAICERVQQMPLLWNPEHPDYKDKDQKTQAWEKLQKEIKPYKPGVSVKETWIQLNRAYNSAINRRKNKRSGSGASDDGKPWKFENAMSFLNVVKTKRVTTSNLEKDDESDASEDEEDIIQTAAKDTEVLLEDDDQSTGPFHQQNVQPIPKLSKQKRKTNKRKAGEDDWEDVRTGLYKALQKQIVDTSKTSPRMKFFECIMPKIESMSEERFLDFQLGVLNLLKTNTPSAPQEQATSRSSTPASWPMSPNSPNSHTTMGYQ